MNEPTDPFDWSSLGDEPLPGEMDDAALLDAVLAQASVAATANEEPAPSSPRWVRPIVTAVVLLAAAVALVLLAPAWTEALRGTDDDGSLAPNVETPEPEDTAVQKHAEASRKAARPSVETRPTAVEPAAVEAQVEPEMPTEDDSDTDAAPARSQPKPTVAPPAADDLLRRAQDALAAKDNRGAVRAYNRLLKAHPRSPEARAARLSLGRLELAAGHGKKALSHYDAYLRGKGGTMRREAKLGRIDALRALGRASAERTAIEAFLDAHPNTVHATRLRARLDDLR